MCDDKVTLLVPTLSEPNEAGVRVVWWAEAPVDRCISGLVKALNAEVVLTASCCCGHGKGPGEIVMHDGRVLLVLDTRERADETTVAILRVLRGMPTARERAAEDRANGASMALVLASAVQKAGR